MTYLHHVTLTTGHSTTVPRNWPTEDELARAAAAIDSMLTGGRPPIRPGWHAHGVDHGRNLTVTLVHDRAGPVLTTGVALTSRTARRLWRAMHDAASIAVMTDREAVPPAPWIADRIEAGALDPTVVADMASGWTGCWSSAIGWAWMEYDRKIGD